METEVSKGKLSRRTGTIGQQSMQQTQPFQVPVPQRRSKSRTKSENDFLYARAAFRKPTMEKARAEAPRNSSGSMLCPTCGEVIPETIVVNTKKGPRKRRGYDLDHYPDTWEKRKKAMQESDTPPTRKQVLDQYNLNVRVQCPKCNQGHKFEGVKGAFADGE